MTFSLTFFIGILWSLVLLVGAAYPEELKIKKPIQSKKNWLFGIWWLMMLAYAIMWYLAWWAIFFVFLEVLIAIASILMMLNTNDRLDAVILSISGIALAIRSLYLFEGYATIIFILGLAWLGLWYAFKMGSLRRDLALTIWSLLVAFFSYLEASRIFFFLNIFFAVFSLYYTIRRIYLWRKKTAKVVKLVKIEKPINKTKKPTKIKKVVKKWWKAIKKK